MKSPVFEFEDSLPEEFNPVFKIEPPPPTPHPNLPQIKPTSVQQVNQLPVQIIPNFNLPHNSNLVVAKQTVTTPLATSPRIGRDMASNQPIAS